MKVAFIGLGIMGSRMATNLLKQGVDLTVYNRSKAAGKALESLGATLVESANEAVASADLIFSMLSTPEAVHAVFLEKDAALANIPTGSIWVDCSTVNPSFSLTQAKAAKKQGVRFVDAPVAGTKPHATNAELVFFSGAEKEEQAIIQPYLEMMGKKVIVLGEVGKGASFKMLVNLMLAQSMLIFSESLLLGEKMGLDPNFLLNTLPNLVVAPPFTKAKAEMIREADYEVQFPLEWMYKDLQLASLTAYENDQPLYLANLTKELYAAAKQAGLGRKDFAAIHEYLTN